jgi:Uma2 family endonuclease
VATHDIRPHWVTAREFERDPVFRHNKYILNGEVFDDMGNAQRLHEIMKARLHQALLLCLLENGISGRVFSETAYQLDDYSVLIPDISVQLPERAGGPGFFQGLPEIAIEILSPANSLSEIERKAQAYWAHGVGAVWVVDPEARQTWSIDAAGTWIESVAVEVNGFLVEMALLYPEVSE